MPLDNIYWSSKGKYQVAIEQLQKLIPEEGSVPSARGKNAKLEQFRKAVNCYYDLYNNGLYNRAREFSFVFFPATKHRLGGGWYTDYLYTRVEELMDKFILAAAKEQGIEVSMTEEA